jgi:outer membrane protein
MNTIRAVSVFVLCIFFNRGIAQNNTPAGKLSLKQCVETAFNNNLDVQQGNILVERSKIDWNQARLNLLPSLNGSASTTFAQGRTIDPATNSYINTNANYANYGLASDVVLFNGLNRQNLIKQNGLAYEATRMDWQQVKDNLTINIILAYLEVLINEDLLELSRNQLTLSKNQVDRLEILNREGAIAPSLLSDLKGEYADNQLSIINTETAMVTAKIALSQLMNIPFDKNMEVERLNAESYTTKYDLTPDSIYQVALQQFAQVRAADLWTQSASRRVKAARGLMYPTLSLGGNLGTSYGSTFYSTAFLPTSQDVTSNDYVLVNGVPSPVVYRIKDTRQDKIPYQTQLNNNLSSSVGLSLRIPIFNSFFYRNQVKLAKLTLKDNELQAKTTKTQLQQSIERAYTNMTSAADKYKVLLEQVNAYQESFRAAEIRFNAGVGTSIDYLTAKNNLDRANTNVIMAKYDYVLRTKVLDYYQGKQLW